MSVIKKIVNGVVTEIDDSQMVKTVENGVVVEKPFGEVKKKPSLSDSGSVGKDGQFTLTGHTLSPEELQQRKITQPAEVLQSTSEDPIGNALNPLEEKANKHLFDVKQMSAGTRLSSESTKPNIPQKFVKGKQNEEVAAINDMNSASHDFNDKANILYNVFWNNGKEAGDYVQRMVERNKPEDLQNNKTVQFAFGRFQDYNNKKQQLASDPDLWKLAVDQQRQNDPNFDAQISALEKGQRIEKGEDAYKNYIPQVVQGRLLDQLSHDKDINVIASENPAVKQQLDQLQNGGVYKAFPEYGETVARNIISREYEKRKANMVANPIFNQSKYLDKLSDELFANNPALKEIADTRLKGHWQGKIDTPDVTAEFGTGAKKTFQQIGESFKDFIGVGKPEDERIKEGLENEYGHVSSGVTGWRKNVGTAANFAGMLATMAAAGKPLTGTGLSQQAANTLITAHTFFDQEKNTATMKYPGEPWKANLEAAVMTTLYGVAGNALPTKQLSKVLSDAKPELESVIKNLDEGMADTEVKSKLSDIIGNAIKGNLKGVGEMTAITVANQALDRTLGLNGQDFNKYHPDDEYLDVAKTMLIGGALPHFITAFGNRNSVADGLFSMADNPIRYEGVLKNAGLSDVELNKKLEDLKFLSDTKQALDQQELSEPQQKRYLLEAMQQRDKMKNIPITPDSTLLKKAGAEIDRHETVKNDILSGKEVEELPKDESIPEIKNHVPKPREEKTDADIENRMTEIETNGGDKDEFNRLEKEMESRERSSVFGVTLDKIRDSVDALMKKEKEKPNGYGAFIEKKDARETKEIANKYLSPKEISDEEVKKDFKEALMGNPDMWYADGLKLRESAKLAAERGIKIDDLLSEVEKEFVKNGHDSNEAKKVIAERLKSIFKRSKKSNEKEDEAAKLSIETEDKGADTSKIDEAIGATEAGEGGPPPPTAVPTQPGPESGENKVGISHSALTALSEKLGLKPPERGDYLPPEWYADRGRKLLAAGADPNEVNNPNNELHDRISIARAHLETLVKGSDEIAKSNPEGTESKEYQKATEEINEYSNNTVKKLGTLAHRAFESLKGERDIDTDSFTSVKKAVEDRRQGGQASPEQVEKIKELTSQNNNLRQRAEEAEARLIQVTNEDMSGEKPKPKEKTKKTHEQYVKERKDSFQAAREALKKLRTGESGLGASLPLVRELTAVAPHISKIVKSLLEEGVDKLEDIVDTIHEELSKDMKGLRRRDIVDLVAGDYSKQKDEAKAPNKYGDIKKQSKLVQKLEDLQNGLPEDFDPKKTDQSPEVKALLEKIKKVKKDLKDMGYMEKKNKTEKKELTPEEKNINRLEKELDDLQNGVTKNKPETREQSKKEKELKAEIQDEKNKIEVKRLQELFVDKKGKFTTEESKSIWEYGKKAYLDKGASYREMISKVADDLGLKWKQVSDAITTPKVKSISDAMWKKQSDLRRNQAATKNWVEQQNVNPALKVLTKVSGVFRGVSVFGHGGIFIGTHAGMTFFHPTTWKYTIPAFFRGWKFAYGNHGNYERAMEQLKHSINYVLAQRAGLGNNPERLNAEEYQKSQKFLGKLGMAGEKGFNAIKVLRQNLFDYHYNKLSDAAKADPETAKSIAWLVNNATGATNLKIPKVINEITFAGGMEAARWGKLTRNPIKATGIALKALYSPDKVSVQDRVFAKVWANRVGQEIGTYAGILSANAAIQSMVSPNNPVNLFNPNKPDFLKFKFGDTTIDPTSGMRGAANFIYGLGKIPFMTKKERHGDTVLQAAGKQTFGYGRGKLAPLYSTMADFYTHTDYNKNELPYSNEKPAKGSHKLTWGEYAWEHAPLPIAEAAHVMYQAATENGDNKITVNNILQGILSGAISGGTGFRVGEYNAEEANHSPYTAADKKDQIFKYFLDKGMELPNTSLTSEVITNEKNRTKKTVADYPIEKQKQYQDTHKEYLKQELSEVKKRGWVYVREYTDAKGDKVNEVSVESKPHAKKTSLDDLDEKEMAQVLSKAQSKATERTKKKLFNQK